MMDFAGAALALILYLAGAYRGLGLIVPAAALHSPS